ncbi:hypothetical protein CsSME_00028417 [Camellia sinensis var. sinensis]
MNKQISVLDSSSFLESSLWYQSPSSNEYCSFLFEAPSSFSHGRFIWFCVSINSFQSRTTYIKS